MTDVALGNQRSGVDRRVRRVPLHYPDRRTGFDRRMAGVSRYQRLLDIYRSRDGLVAVCLAAIVVLNLTDLALTRVLIGLGASEVNPIMAGLLAAGAVPAVAVKVAVTIAVVGGVWVMRRYRRMLEFSLVLLGALALLAVYQVAGVVLLAS